LQYPSFTIWSIEILHQKHTMPFFKDSFGVTKASCWLCTFTEPQPGSTCIVCSPSASPSKQISNASKQISSPSNNKLQYHRRYLRASVLHRLVEASKGDYKAFKTDLEMLVDITKNDKMVPIRPDNPEVMLASGYGNDVPAIRLQPAEGEAPTMDIISWQTLGSPTWAGNDVYVCVERRYRTVHKRSKHCKGCQLAVWMDCAARILFEGTKEADPKALEWKADPYWTSWMPKRSLKKRALTKLQSAFQPRIARTEAMMDLRGMYQAAEARRLAV
jgi:hypothetical protein